LVGVANGAELAGCPVLSFTDPSSRDLVARRMQAAVGSLPHDMTRVTLLPRDGRAATLEVAPAQGIEFRGGPARLVVGVDVTERVALEQRLIVADRVASIGLLGAGVAHEINNPLAYAMANLEIARREAEKLGASETPLMVSLGTAQEGLGRVRAIVRDLNALARVDDEPPAPVDLHAVLESTLTLAASAVARRARVVRTYRDVPRALATVPRLGQVALNLVLNAVDSMRDDGAVTNELRVRIFAEDAAHVAFEIEDTGDGIEPAAIGRVFDPFFTTKPTGRGTGLGLAICEQIVAGFGGTITVRSSPGSGATFRVSLPAAAREALEPDPESVGPASREVRLLVVDDEPLIVTMIGRMLADEGWASGSASSGREALEKLGVDPGFDAVICDLMMPGMTGLELHEAVRARWPDLASRVLFVTGGVVTDSMRASLARMPNRCLAKPFTAGDLIAEVRRLVARPR
jgi:two-component system, cell cycle sensor histidine kinase and response regulator CckA